MGKAAGIWKKIKQVGKTIGKGLGKAASWVNENIYKPGKDLFHPVFEMIDNSGTLNKIADGVSRVIDYGAEKLGYVPDNSFAPLTETASDMILDTQRSKKDKKYKDPFEAAIQINEKINDSINDYNVYRRMKNDQNRTIVYDMSDSDSSDEGEDWSDYSDSEYSEGLSDSHKTVSNMIRNARTNSKKYKY